MPKALAMLVAAVTLLAALADIASFLIANGGIITRAVVEMATRATATAAASRPAPCRKTAVIRLDPECSQISDPQRSADCLRTPPPQMEICLETVQSR
jgi:hypothetical protein